MREVLAARSDHDFITDAPPRRRAQARVREPESLQWSLLSFALAHPIEIAVGAVLMAAASAIVWNALALQTARHPAPLFGSKEVSRSTHPAPLPPARPVFEPIELEWPQAPVAESAPVSPKAVSRNAIGDLIRFGAPPTRPAPAPQAPAAAVAGPSARAVPTVVAVPSRPPVMRDAIGDLIRLGEPAPVPPGLVGRPEPSRVVAQGQKALIKLGFGPLDVDGVMGSDTRQATERFERVHRLPVTGEFGPRTARELAVRSGLPVD